MKPRTIAKLLRTGQVPVLLRLEFMVRPLYRASFVAQAASSGVLSLLAGGPATLDHLADHLGTAPEDHEMLRGWLELGVRLKELRRDGSSYALRGWWSRKLAQPRNDVAAAALEEVVKYHQDVLVASPPMSGRRRFSLADQDGELVARATRILEPFVQEAVDLVLPRSGALRWLEVGCGEAAHVRHACERNPELEVMAIDLQPQVAAAAERNIGRWGLDGRVSVRSGDIRTSPLPGGYDVVTLHNLIYYFPLRERVELLERLRSLLAPGGKLLLTSGCQGGNLGLEVINLWFSASDAGGPLPVPADLRAQLLAAGFDRVEVQNLKPGDAYYAFIAHNPMVEMRAQAPSPRADEANPW
ncbi:MAG: methyltransferase domain-containing protein [Kofleriaceae bacterium]